MQKRITGASRAASRTVKPCQRIKNHTAADSCADYEKYKVKPLPPAPLLAAPATIKIRKLFFLRNNSNMYFLCYSILVIIVSAYAADKSKDDIDDFYNKTYDCRCNDPDLRGFCRIFRFLIIACRHR